MSTLEELVSRHQVTEIIYRFARGVDRLDVELFRSCFWEDGGYSHFPESPPMHDFAGIICGQLRDSFSQTQHLNSNIRISFPQSDSANVETYFLAFHRTHEHLGRERLEAVVGARRLSELSDDVSRAYDVIAGGRYLDHFERRGNEWRIKGRRVLVDWTNVHPASGLRPNEGLIAGLDAGGPPARDRSDPSYAYGSQP